MAVMMMMMMMVMFVNVSDVRVKQTVLYTISYSSDTVREHHIFLLIIFATFHLCRREACRLHVDIIMSLEDIFGHISSKTGLIWTKLRR